MRRWIKVFAWCLAGLATLLLAAFAVLYFLVPRDKIIAFVVPKAEQALHRPVHLEDAGVSIWPPFGVYLTRLRVEDTLAGADLLRVETLRAQLAWRPLLSGELRLSSLSVGGLDFHYERFDDSTTNLSDLLAGEGGLWPVVERLEFENLKITMADRRDTTAWAVEGVSADLSLDAVSLAFECRLRVPQLRSRHADSVAVYPGPFAVEAVGKAQRNPPALTVSELSGTIRDVPLGGLAVITSAASGAAVEGRLLLGPTPLPVLLALLPSGPAKAAAAYDISGDLQLRIHASGPLDQLARGAAEAELTWTEGRIADSTGEWLSFSSLTIPVDHEGFHVDAERLVTRFGPVQLAAVGAWPPEDRLELSISGQSRIASLLGPDTAGVSGAVDWSASGYGPMTDPMGWQVRARAQLSEVRFVEPSRQPFFVDEGELSYDGNRLKLERLRARYGRSDLELEGEVEGISWKAYKVGRTLSPAASLRLRSSHLDLDALFPHLAGDSAAPADTSARPPLPRAHVRLSADVDTLVLAGAVWRRVHGEFTLADQGCVIDTLYGSVYGGRVQMAGRIDSVAQAVPAYTFRLQADSLEIGALLSRFGSAGRHLRGQSELAAEFSGRGNAATDLASALRVDGSVRLFDARLEQLSVVPKIQALLGLKLQDPVPLKSVTNRFQFAGGRVQLEDFRFTTPQGTWTLGGSAGLDGSLDYELAGRMPPELAARVALPESWTTALPAEWRGRIDPIDLLKDDDGAIDLYFRIGGVFRSPEVSVDWEKLEPLFKQRFESRLKEKLTLEAEKKLKEGLQGLFDKLKR